MRLRSGLWRLKGALRLESLDGRESANVAKRQANSMCGRHLLPVWTHNGLSELDEYS